MMNINNECKGHLRSNCCGAQIEMGDICSQCKEHCDSQCEDCPVEDKVKCEEITKR